ncbi:MAG TPA: hypothetical protein VKZ43_02955 [Trueperaceae bacterium]|nr:hypothetical protein [Trueperaceae bacterium]
MSEHDARILAARQYMHDATCWGPSFPCLTCPTPSRTLLALQVLDEQPRAARKVRRIFHDAICMSGCGPDSDHADRTQAKTAAALRRFHASEAAA